MAKKRFNWIAVIVLLISLAVLAVTAFGLRRWQLNRKGTEALETGLEAYEDSKWQRAATNLGRYLAINQTDKDILLKYADAQLRIRPLKRNNIQQAIAAYRSVLRIDRDNSIAAEKLVSLYLDMKIPTEAELIAGRYLQTNEHPQIAAMLAAALSRQRKNDQAVSLLQKIIEDHPGYIAAYEALGRLAGMSEDYTGPTAEHWLDEAVKNNPDSAEALIIRANFYLRNNRNQQALRQLEKAEKLDLSDPAVHLRLADGFARAGMFDKAVSHLTEIRSRNPKLQQLWHLWAMIAMQMRSEEHMLEVAGEGLKELSDEPWDFMPVAAELFIRSGKSNLAEECIEKLKQKDIALAVTLFLEGLLASAENHNYQAVQAWRLARNSGDRTAKTRLMLAQALARCGDSQSAILELRKLVSEQPGLFEAHLELARLVAQVGNWPQAAEYAHRAMQISPERIDAELLYMRARIEITARDAAGSNDRIWTEIQNRLNELQELSSEPRDVLLLKFQLEMRRKNFSDAEKILTSLKPRQDSEIEIAMAEIELLTARDKTEESISKLYVLLEKFPQSTQPVEYLAHLLAQHRGKDECEKLIKDTMVRLKNPDQKRDLGILMARFYNSWQQDEKAFELLEALAEELAYDIPVRLELLKYAPLAPDAGFAQRIVDEIKTIEGQDSWQWRYAQAGIWFSREQFDDYYPRIVELLKENIVVNPDDQTSRMLLARTYEKAGELQLAVATYRQSLTRSADDIRIIVSTVAAMYKAGEYEQADAILNRAAGQKIAHPELSMLELQSHLRQGRLDSAEDILEDLVSRDPNDHGISLSLALLKMSNGEYDQASQILDRLRTLEPKNLSVITAMVELNLRQQNRDRAMAVCNETVKQFGSADAFILRARTRLVLGETDLAKEDFEQATAIEPDNPKSWISKSDFNRSIADFEQALHDIQKAIAIAPKNINIQKRAITLLLASPEKEKKYQGNRLLEQALSGSPHDIELRLYKANRLLAGTNSANAEEAILILQKIIEEQPKITEAWALMAQMYLKNAQYAKAMDTLLQGLAFSSEDRQLLLLKARTEAARAPELAIPTLKLLCERQPDDVDLALELADTCIAANHCDQGVELLRNLLERCEQNKKRRVNIALASALYKNGSKDQSQSRFEMLYQSQPNDPAAFLAEAKCLAEDNNWSELNDKITRFSRQKDNTETLTSLAGYLASSGQRPAQNVAETLLRKILEHRPDTLSAMHTLAMILQMTGRNDQAAQLYENILKADPDAIVAINNLAWIMCENQGKYQQAQQFAQEGLKKAPDYIDLIDTEGVICYRLSDYQGAARNFKRCIEMYPENSSSLTGSYFHLARALAALNQNHTAIENIKLALDMNSRVGGLSRTEMTESHNLLKELSRGESYAIPTK